MTLIFWINAFIPGDVPGYTIRISKGVYAGKTAIPLPWQARINPLNWKDWDAGYLTDQRGFSNEMNASVRMQSKASFNVNTPKMVEETPSQRHRTSGTTEVDIKTGKKLGYGKANMTRCSFEKEILYDVDIHLHPGHYFIERSPQITQTRDYTWTSGDTIYAAYKLKAAAGDPLVSAAAHIDYVGTVTLGVNKKAKQVTLKFDGKVDNFPAFEAYAQYNSTTKTLFRKKPPRRQYGGKSCR